MSGISFALEGLQEYIDASVDAAVARALTERDPDDHPFDSAQAAAYLGVSRRRIHDLVNEGKLPRRSDGPGCKLWFYKADLNAYAGGLT